MTADFPGTREFGPYGRAGLATLLALALFALPPIITNAYVAVREVPADVKQAADGHGDDRARRSSSGSSCRSRCRWSCRGVRLALVQVWATATIAALVAGPGPGPGHHRRLLPHQLRQGHRRRRSSSALVALVLELIAAAAPAAGSTRCAGSTVIET